MRAPAILLLIWVLAWPASLPAQTFAETNQRAATAFGAGDVETALALTRDVVDVGIAQGKSAPVDYLNALNNLTFLGGVQSITPELYLERAEAALAFAHDTDLEVSAGGIAATLNTARGQALMQQRTASTRNRNAAVNASRGSDWHGPTLGGAVDLAFLNRDHAALPALIEEMRAIAGGYIAQTNLDQLFERQGELEEAGDVDGVSALVDARILLVGAIQPDMESDFAHAALWTKFYMNYEAERFGAAADALRAWAGTGTLSADEAAFIDGQAEQSLLLSQFEGYSDRDNVQLGFTQLTLAFAELSYPPEDARIGLALREKGAAEGRMGQYEAAQRTLQDALLILSQTSEGQAEIFLVLEDLASNAWQRGDLDQAHQLFARAEAAQDAARAQGATPLSDYDRSILLSNRAQLEIERGAFDAATDLLAQAQSHFDAFEAGGEAKSNDLWHRVTLAQTNALLIAEGPDDVAAQEAALLTVEAANRFYPPAHPRRAMALANAADQLFFKGDRATGRDLLRQAHEIAQQSLPKGAPLTTEVEVKLALDALAEGNRAEAITLMRSVVTARVSPEHRVDLSGVGNNFEILAWMLLSQPEIDTATLDEALAALQWTHVSQSAEALAMMETRLSASDPELAVLLKTRQNVLSDLDLNRSALNVAYAAGGDTAGILSRQQDLLIAAETADAALQSAGLDLAGPAPIKPLRLREIQDLLGPDEVVVTFLLPSLAADQIPGLGGSSNRAIAIRHDGYRIAEVPEGSRGALNRSIDAFRCEMAISDVGCAQSTTAALRGSMNLTAGRDQSLGFDWTVAHDLYETLFGGIAPALNSQDSLIIIPPSDLLRLPFQALITKPQSDFDLGSADWLISQHPVSVLPSLAALDALKRIAPADRAEVKILGVGDPVIGSAPDIDCTSFELASLRSAGATTGSLYAPRFENGLRLANVDELRGMNRLPDATCELQAIERTFGAGQSDLLLRGAATEERLKSLDARGELANYDILVFATHGVIAGETSAVAPGLVLTPPDTASARDDGLLTAAEVANLTLSARLVILSACNTAAGRDASQEGLSGLASGFFQAGARSLMVTHWAVFSAASAEVTTRLSGLLAEDPSASNATALRRAILGILEDDTRDLRSKHPSYWAPFAIVGL